MWFALLAVFLPPFFYYLRKYAQGTQFKKNHIRIDRKVVIITGCNTGIGKETALDLARRGAKIYMACRDVEKCELARKEIISKTNNINIFNRQLDLSSLESVRQFVKRFLAEENRLDILINNAGLMLPQRSLTKDGYETQFATNHLGHFLLTNLLLDLLKKSAPSRVVNVSSMGHAWGRINKDDIQHEQNYKQFNVYCQTKLANVLFTRELAKRLKGTSVVTNSLHPGAVVTDFGRYQPWYQHLMYPFRPFFKTPKSGAQTTIAVAIDPDLANVTGKYFSDCKIKKESKYAQDDEMAKWLWLQSEKMVGIGISN